MWSRTLHAETPGADAEGSESSRRRARQASIPSWIPAKESRVVYARAECTAKRPVYPGPSLGATAKASDIASLPKRALASSVSRTSSHVVL